jgi:hypothetical protein
LARHRKDLLEQGRFGSVIELAGAVMLDKSYVARLLRLTLLAPDIVESILRGNEPPGMTLNDLVQTLSVEWGAQYGLFRQ